MTKTEICNMALARIGVSRFVKDIDTDQSNEANTLRLFYGICLNRVLEESNPGFAEKTAELADIGSPVNGWAYRYRYPSDCLVARMVNYELTDLASALADVVYGDVRKKIPFIVTEDAASDGRAICCNISPAYLVYTMATVNTALFSAAFIDALAWNLAMEIASPLSAAPGMSSAAGSAYMKALSRFNVSNANESQQAEYVGEYESIRG